MICVIALCVLTASCGGGGKSVLLTTSAEVTTLRNVEDVPATELTEPAGQTAETVQTDAVTEQPVTPVVPAGSSAFPSEDFRPTLWSKNKAIKTYAEAVNAVKEQKAGFTVSRHTEIGDVSAANDLVDLATNIVNLVAQSIAKAGDGVKTVARNSDGVRSEFPLAGRDVGYDVTDESVIEDAVCEKSANYYRITLTLAPTVNSSAGDGALGGVADPVERQGAYDVISNYVVIIDKNQFKLDVNYSGCSVTAYIDRDTGRLARLEHRLNMGLDFDLNVNLVAFTTSFVKATGTASSSLDFYDFIW
ncbi:MAG: hypothetical protein K6C36_07395 [Clostridia bacterium]|nr:hypothetical protein [Clostridia bacterium]